mgnify:CR=1 FL=1
MKKRPSLKESETMKKIFPAILALAAASFAFAAQEGSPAGQKAVGCLGKILPGETIARLAAPSPSGSAPIIEKLFIKKGQAVEKGAEIALLMGSGKAAAAVSSARAELASAKAAAELEVARQRNAVAELAGTYEQNVDVLRMDPPRSEREKINYEQKAILRQLEQAKGLLPLVQANAESSVARAGAALAEAEAALAEYTVRSPISGEIIEVNSKPGEAVGEGGLCEIADTGTMFVEAEVYVSDITKVKVGDRAECSPEAIEPQMLPGTVSEISPYVKSNRLFSQDPAEYADRKVVPVKIRLENPAAVKNLIGSPVRVRIFVK